MTKDRTPRRSLADERRSEAEGHEPSVRSHCEAKDRSENGNHIYVDGFSRPATFDLYDRDWPAEPTVREKCRAGFQCGGCSFYAKFNEDWGLCCHPRSRHWLETVFEHFTCPTQDEEGWDAHSFAERRLRDAIVCCREPSPSAGERPTRRRRRKR